MERINSLIIHQRHILYGGDSHEYIVLKKTVTPKQKQDNANEGNKNEIEVLSSEEVDLKPKNTRKRQRKNQEEEEIKEYEEKVQNTLQIRQVITKYIPTSHVVHLNKTFKYFVPSTELFYENYPEQNMYLVQWQNYSMPEATWILESEATSSIDKNGLIKKFESIWELNYQQEASEGSIQRQKVIYPLLEEIVPIKLLIPTKILVELPQLGDKGEPITMYRVKWPGSMELFVSDELDSFFTKERNKSVLERWLFKPQDFPLRLNKAQIDVLNLLKKNITQDYDALLFGGYGKRTTVMAFLLHRIKSEKISKPHIIVCDESSLPYYYNQLPFLFPGIPITYIVTATIETQLEMIFDMELYDEDENLKPQIVVYCCKKFTFKKHIKFDCMMIDVQKEENMNFKLVKTSFCDHFIAVARENCPMERLTEFLKRKTKNALSKIELVGDDKPKISTIFLMSKQQAKQTAIYQQTLKDLKICKKSIGLTEDLRRVLLFPNISSYGVQIKGIKMTTSEKIVKALAELNKKVIIVSPIPQLVDTLSQNFKCHYIKWDNSITSNKEISCSFRDANEQDENKLSKFVVCLDSNSHSEGVDLSVADYMIMLDDDYSEGKVNELCQTRRMGTNKDLKIIYIVIEGTEDETNAAASRNSGGINSVKINKDTPKFLNSQTTFSLNTKCLEEILRAKPGINVLKFGTEDEVKEFNAIKEEEEKKRQEEEKRLEEERKRELEEKNKLYIEKKSMKMIMTRNGVESIGNDYLEVVDGEMSEEDGSVEIVGERKSLDMKKEEEKERKRRKRSRIDECIKSEEEIHEDLDEESVVRLINESSQQVLSKIENIVEKAQIEGEEKSRVSKTLICLYKRFGKYKDDWPKGIFQTFSTKLQKSLPTIMKSLNRIKLSDEIEENHENFQRVKEAVGLIKKSELDLVDVVSCEWGTACDLLLLEEVKKCGLGCPRLWLKNPILKYMVIKLNLNNEKDQIEFVNDRSNALINSLKTNDSIKRKYDEGYQAKRKLIEISDGEDSSFNEDDLMKEDVTPTNGDKVENEGVSKEKETVEMGVTGENKKDETHDNQLQITPVNPEDKMVIENNEKILELLEIPIEPLEESKKMDEEKANEN